jgi:hypothetical protein
VPGEDRRLRGTTTSITGFNAGPTELGQVLRENPSNANDGWQDPPSRSRPA